MASGNPFEPVHAADQDVADAAVAELGEDLHPELRALGFLKPHAQHVSRAIHGHPEREIAGPSLHRPAVADLEHQRIKGDHRIDVLQRALLPRPGVVHDRVGDAADQIPADLDAIDVGQVRLDIPR